MLRTTAFELFKGLSDSDLRRVARLCNEQRYSPGQILFDNAAALFPV